MFCYKLFCFFILLVLMQIKWHPFLLNPSAPKEGVNKKDYYKSKFGSRADQMHARMSEVYQFYLLFWLFGSSFRLLGRYSVCSM